MNETGTLPTSILHVLPLRNSAGGGIAFSLHALRAGLPADVRLAVLLPAASAAFPWVARLREDGIATHFAASAREVSTAIRRIRPTLTHIHFVEWQVSGTIGAARIGSRILWHLHSGLPVSTRTTALARVKYALAAHFVERFLCVSGEIAAYIRAYGIPERKIAVVPNGVDLQHFHLPSDAERSAARAALQLESDERTIVFFGRDAVVKGADRLAASLVSAREMHHAVYTILAIAASAETLEVLARAGRVRDCGTVADVRKIFWAADVLALPSRTEALPFSVLEARATGLPVAANDLPGIQQFSADPGTALVPFEAHAFAEEIERLAQRGPIALLPPLAQDLSLERWTDRMRGFYSSSSIRSA